MRDGEQTPGYSHNCRLGAVLGCLVEALRVSDAFLCILKAAFHRCKVGWGRKGGVVNCITRQLHHQVWNTAQRLWSPSAAPIASHGRGLSPKPRTGAWTEVGQGTAWDLVPHSPNCCSPQSTRLGWAAQSGDEVLGLSKAGAQLAGCFGRLQIAACSPSIQPLAHAGECGREQLPEPPPSSCSPSPGLALLRAPSTFSIPPCIPGCAALP